jgi:hypothetical protein
LGKEVAQRAVQPAADSVARVAVVAVAVVVVAPPRVLVAALVDR